MSPGRRPIALIAMPGGGKSTIGKHLAKRLSWRFVDSDAAIEQRIGTSIQRFFELEGEARFRDIESEVIAELASLETPTVLATGGGVVLREGNRQVLQSRCQVVYLHSTPEELSHRLRGDTQRPLLQQGRNLKVRLRQLYDERDPLYRQTAHFVVETNRPSVVMLVDMVMTQLELAGVV